MNQYTDTDQRLHLLSQVITKANRTFIPKKEDDSHTNLYFDALGDRITGRWIETKDDKLLFILNLKSLNIEVINGAQAILVSVPTIGNRIGEIENELAQHLSGLGLRSAGFTEALHYEIPEYPFQAEPVSPISSEAIDSWKHFRQMANEACSLVLGHAQMAEEIRIWPHHFDTGIYALISPKLGLGFGLAMKDEMFGAPYFYMSGYPIDSSINYDSRPIRKDWKWEVGENWNGAVLTLNTLEGKSDVEQKAILIDYLAQSYKWYAAQ